MTTQYVTVKEAVAAGVALLDERGPADWRTRVDIDKLIVSDERNCVITQVFGNYSGEEASKFLVPDGSTLIGSCGYEGCRCAFSEAFTGAAARHGFEVVSTVFDTSVMHFDDIFDALTAEWKRVLSGSESTT